MQCVLFGVHLCVQSMFCNYGMSPESQKYKYWLMYSLLTRQTHSKSGFCSILLHQSICSGNGDGDGDGVDD